ncbi:ATP-binding protein [Anabaena sp. UHCC 0451]|uniref:AAA family ATPase n=1 Tax=Anabaena sp. UHCC 0451 TaxID=2055235 RepID=UPI002B1ED7EC|nr:ATP-binding protein [Anabaena sp. UHCC 0451]MEA5579413.1 ATP-binding protein [Anabaena sp. UHCC 0451]
MLVDFTVENYRSIKEPVTLSAVAQKQSTRKTSATSKRKGIKSDHEIAPGYYVEGWDMEILPVLAIFGANASGKSNVIQALDYLLIMMSRSIQQTAMLQRIFKYAKPEPFKLDNISPQNNTKFELRTIFNNNIYTYYLELNQNHVFHEKLDYAPFKTKRIRRLFDRKWDSNSKQFIWKTGEDFAGSHNLLHTNIKENDLFISTLANLKVDIISTLLDWLLGGWCGMNLGYGKVDFSFIDSLPENDMDRINIDIQQALQIVQKFDTGISGVKIDKQNDSFLNKYNIYAVHKDNAGNEINWLFDEESLGTQRLFELAFWIKSTLKTGRLMIVDELGTNIHPNVVKYIIKMFQNPKTNPTNSQLIFTSHDNTLQRNNLLRRDQIWFTQKRPDHSTELYPLTDFHVRNDLAIDKAYLDGRFGAVPFLPSDEEMILQGDEEWPEI